MIVGLIVIVTVVISIIVYFVACRKHRAWNQRQSPAGSTGTIQFNICFTVQNNHYGLKRLDDQSEGLLTKTERRNGGRGKSNNRINKEQGLNEIVIILLGRIIIILLE